MGFLDIPDEVIQIIISYLDISSFYNLSLSCPTLLKFFINPQYDKLFKNISIQQQFYFLTSATTDRNTQTPWKNAIKRYSNIKQNFDKVIDISDKDLYKPPKVLKSVPVNKSLLSPLDFVCSMPFKGPCGLCVDFDEDETTVSDSKVLDLQLRAWDIKTRPNWKPTTERQNTFKCNCNQNCNCLSRFSQPHNQQISTIIPNSKRKLHLIPLLILGNHESINLKDNNNTLEVKTSKYSNTTCLNQDEITNCQSNVNTWDNLIFMTGSAFQWKIKLPLNINLKFPHKLKYEIYHNILYLMFVEKHNSKVIIMAYKCIEINHNTDSTTDKTTNINPNDITNQNFSKLLWITKLDDKSHSIYRDISVNHNYIVISMSWNTSTVHPVVVLLRDTGHILGIHENSQGFKYHRINGSFVMCYKHVTCPDKLSDDDDDDDDEDEDYVNYDGCGKRYVTKNGIFSKPLKVFLQELETSEKHWKLLKRSFGLNSKNCNTNIPFGLKIFIELQKQKLKSNVKIEKSLQLNIINNFLSSQLSQNMNQHEEIEPWKPVIVQESKHCKIYESLNFQWWLFDDCLITLALLPDEKFKNVDTDMVMSDVDSDTSIINNSQETSTSSNTLNPTRESYRRNGCVCLYNFVTGKKKYYDMGLISLEKENKKCLLIDDDFYGLVLHDDHVEKLQHD